MFFGTPAKLKQTNVTHLDFNGIEINMVESYKYLGIMLDGPLHFDKHVSYLQGEQGDAMLAKKLQYICIIL